MPVTGGEHRDDRTQVILQEETEGTENPACSLACIFHSTVHTATKGGGGL